MQSKECHHLKISFSLIYCVYLLHLTVTKLIFGDQNTLFRNKPACPDDSQNFRLKILVADVSLLE